MQQILVGDVCNFDIYSAKYHQMWNDEDNHAPL